MEEFKSICNEFMRRCSGVESATEIKNEIKKLELLKECSMYIARRREEEEFKSDDILGIYKEASVYDTFYSERLKEKRAELKRAKSTKDCSEDFFKFLKRSKMVKSAKVLDETIAVETADIIFRGVNIGQYVIVFSGTGRFRVYNKTYHIRLYNADFSQHPHINNGGNVCWGHWESSVRACWNSYDLVGLFSILFSVLQEDEVQGTPYTPEQRFLALICIASGQEYPTRLIGETEWDGIVDGDEDDSRWNGGETIIEK